MVEFEVGYTAEATAAAEGYTVTLPTLGITSTGSGTGTGPTYSAAYQAALGAATTAAATSRDLVKQTVEVLWRSLIVRFKKELKYEPATFYLTFDESRTDYGNMHEEIGESGRTAFYESYFTGNVFDGKELAGVGKGQHFGSIVATITRSGTDTDPATVPGLYDFNLQVNSTLSALNTAKLGFGGDDGINFNLSSIFTWIGSFTTTSNDVKPFGNVNQVVMGILNNTLNDYEGYNYDAMQTNLIFNSPGMSISEGNSRPKKKIILNVIYEFIEDKAQIAIEGPRTVLGGQIYSITASFDTGFTGLVVDP